MHQHINSIFMALGRDAPWIEVHANYLWAAGLHLDTLLLLTSFS
jgi:hypothetical protein